MQQVIGKENVTHRCILNSTPTLKGILECVAGYCIKI
jgi:hypothetical protein